MKKLSYSANIKIKLTTYGQAIYWSTSNCTALPKVDKDGFTVMPLCVFLAMYGSHVNDEDDILEKPAFYIDDEQLCEVNA